MTEAQRVKSNLGARAAVPGAPERSEEAWAHAWAAGRSATPRPGTT
jgi:hypothetical protein